MREISSICAKCMEIHALTTNSVINQLLRKESLYRIYTMSQRWCGHTVSGRLWADYVHTECHTAMHWLGITVWNGHKLFWPTAEDHENQGTLGRACVWAFLLRKDRRLVLLSHLWTCSWRADRIFDPMVSCLRHCIASWALGEDRWFWEWIVDLRVLRRRWRLLICHWYQVSRCMAAQPTPVMEHQQSDPVGCKQEIMSLCILSSDVETLHSRGQRWPYVWKNGG